MASLNKSTFFRSFLSYLPIILLFFSVFNEFDFNYLKLDYFSFNFIFIVSKLNLQKNSTLKFWIYNKIGHNYLE